MKRAILFLIILGFLSACDGLYFSEPQPINKKNLQKMPKKLRGTWLISEDGGERYDTVIISKDNYVKKSNEVVGALRSEIDTCPDCMIIGDKFYFKNEKDSQLSEGFDYTIKGDSVFVVTKDVSEIHLGVDAVLREVGDYYTLSVRKDSWWDVRLIDPNHKGKILVRRIKEKELNDMKNYAVLDSVNYKTHILAKWTEEDLLALIKSGGFSDTIATLKKLP